MILSPQQTFITKDLVSFITYIIEKEKESRIKLEALKVQMQFIAEYGRHLLNIGVSIMNTSVYMASFFIHCILIAY